MLVYLHQFIYIFFNVLVEIRRVELLTSCLQGRRSSQLSYIPIKICLVIKHTKQYIKVYYLSTLKNKQQNPLNGFYRYAVYFISNIL